MKKNKHDALKSIMHLNKFLPFGAKSRIARKLGVSHTCVREVMEGKYFNEKVTKEVLNEVKKVATDLANLSSY